MAFELPYLYILMRHLDMDSLRHEPGKEIAQGSHATSMFHERMFEMLTERRELCELAASNATPGESVKVPDLHWNHIQDWNSWKEDRRFGTAITLEVDERTMRGAVALAQAAGFMAEICTDPTYPLKDGKTMHFFPVDTCAYIFGYKSKLAPLLGQYNLLKEPEEVT